MKKDIHPTYYTDARVICACGNTWTTGSTRKVIQTDVCSKCHPFFTGEQRIVDTEGQVDRFYKKLEARKQYLSDVEVARRRLAPHWTARLLSWNSAHAPQKAWRKPALITWAMSWPSWHPVKPPCWRSKVLVASPWLI